jgi:hypothetical protein
MNPSGSIIPTLSAFMHGGHILEWMIAPHESMKLSKNFMGGSFYDGVIFKVDLEKP